MNLPTLYKVNSKGKVQLWKIYIEDNALVTEWGIKGMKMQKAERAVDTNKSNRNIKEQCEQEAHAKWKKKQDSGYMIYQEEDNTEIKTKKTAMLAKTWEPEKNQIKKWPVYVQRKYDGLRCRAFMENGEIVLRTRNNQEIKYLHHIRESLVPLFEQLHESITNFCFDGELYTFKLPFQVINGLVKRKRATEETERLIEYHIFDCDLDGDYIMSERLDFLESLEYTYPCMLVKTEMAHSKEDILKMHDEYVAEGYEGIIIRIPDSLYVGSRVSVMFKYKEFMDEEYPVLSATTSKGREEGAVNWILGVDGDKTISVRPRGTLDERKVMYSDYLSNPDRYIGRMYRIRFQGLSEDGIPRFPVGIDFIDDR